MPRQTSSWSCSACALAWLERALWVNASADEWSCVEEIGQPKYINPTYGLMNGDGSRLREVLESYGVQTSQAWLTYGTVYALAQQGPLLMAGGVWNHWCGVRGVSGADLALANSAPGWMAVQQTMDRDQFLRLGGFSVIWLA